MWEALLVLTIALVVVTLVGHGIWLLLAFLFRLLTGRPGRRTRRRVRCVYCRRLTPAAADRCDWCGKSLHSEMAEELADLDAVARQLDRFLKANALKPGAADRLLARVRDYRRRLVEPPATVPKPPKKEPAEEIIVAELAEQKEEVRPATEDFLAPGAKPQTAPAAGPQAAGAKPQAAAALAKPETGPEPKLPPAPKPPRRSWAEMLAAFMEERNIRWGELVGGLLIVCSSVALVISLWDALEQIPYFPFLIVVAVSSAVFGVGLYAHHRWELESTSRGTLIIATLLVPLNFLFMAGVSGGEWDLISMAIGVASLGVFAWLVGLAARVLMPEGRWLAVLATVGNSAVVMLFSRRFGAGISDGLLVSAGCLPAAIFVASIGGYLYRLSEHKRLDLDRVGALLTLLGTAAFALAAAHGLLVVRGTKAVGLGHTLNGLSVSVALAAVPILACGLTVMRRLVRDTALEAYRTAGTMLALLGIVVMLAALGLAWPQPSAIVAVGTFCGAALALVAFRYRLPIAHGGTIACLALVYMTGFHWILSDLGSFSRAELGPQMVRLAASASSGTALAGVFLILGAISELLARRGYRRHGAVYAAGCGAVAAVGLLLVTWHGLLNVEADSLRAAILYGVYGAVSLALAGRWRQPWFSYLGLALLAAAPMWALWWHVDHVGPWWSAMLAAEALVMGLSAAALGQLSGRPISVAWNAVAENTAGKASDLNALVDLYRKPLLHVAECVGPLAIAAGLWTAWFDGASIDHNPALVLAVGCLAALYLLLAWGYQSTARTWAGSMVLLAGLIHTLAVNYADLVEQRWAVALLSHATAALLGGVLLDVWARRPAMEHFRGDLRRVFVEPLGQTALLSSAFVLPVLAVWGDAFSLSWCLFWLAAIWLVLAWINRSAELMTACQAVLTLAVLAATTAWLERRPEGFLFPNDLVDPQVLQAYGIGLALLTLIWIAARMACRKSPVARELLNPAWPAVDRMVGHTVIVGQLLLVAGHLLPGCAWELLPIKPPAGTLGTQLAAFGFSAWLLLGILAAGVVVALWQRWGNAEVASAVLLAGTVPCLVAGRFAPDQATASALRWGLSLALIVCSTAVWDRERLARLAGTARMQIAVSPAGPRLARGLLVATTVVPVLAITVLAAGLQLGGTSPGGPAAQSFFERLGPSLSYLVPLLLVLIGLVGYAFREASAGYAFSGGLVADLVVTLGYALHVVLTPGRRFEIAELVTLVQLGTITTALWAVAWLVARRWVDVWREGPKPGSARTLMRVQLGMGAAGNVLLLVPALVALVLLSPHTQQWTEATGWPTGWLALVLVAAAAVYRRVQQQEPASARITPNAAGFFGMAALGLLACSVQAICAVYDLDPRWGYRTLMLGWAVYALLVVAATWWVATVRTLPGAQGPPQALVRAAAVWVRVAGVLAVLLGLKAAFWHDEQLWGAAAIAVASMAGAAMAIWRRREGWAFSAALGVNLAASLVVWHFQREFDLVEWWIRLLEANVIASSAVALVWQAARRRLLKLRELTVRTSPLLAAQVTLAVAGITVLLVLPVAHLVIEPVRLPGVMAQLADASGWLALVLVAAAAGWFAVQLSPRNLLNVLCPVVLGVGVLGSCYTANFNGPASYHFSDWLSYHVLTTAWSATALLVLALGWLVARVKRADGGGLSRAVSSLAARLDLPASLVQAWVTTIGLLTLFLALIWCHADLGDPWWSVRAVLVVSAAAGLLAMWRRLPAYVYFSGLLVNVAGTVLWMAWGPGTAAGLVYTNVLCLAVASGVWTLLRPAHPQGVPDVVTGGRRLPFAHVAAQAGLALLGLLVTLGVAIDVLAVGHLDVDRLGWIALAALAVELAMGLWDRSASFAPPGLYLAGLLAVGMGLVARKLGPSEFCWTAGVESAGFVLLMALLGWCLPRLKPVWQTLRIPDAAGGRSAEWFMQGQTIAAGAAAALAAWISIDPAHDVIAHGGAGWLVGRSAGAVAAAMLLPAAILMAAREQRTWRAGWQYATLGLGVLLLSCLGWTGLDAGGPAPWLHRSVVLLLALAAMTLAAAVGLRGLLPRQTEWIASGRRIAPVLAGLALAVLLVVLVAEGLLYEAPGGVPMAWWAIGVVAAALAGLAVGCIALAVVPGLDPFGWSERGRTVYVYAAEVLAVLVCVHLRLTMPWLFDLGIIEKYWMLLVMAVAFVGAGLSEWFERRGVPVLSEPLARTALVLPLAPAVGFWFMAGASPAMWFLMGLFYGFLAVTRRSAPLAALGVLAANMGLWVLLQRHELDFLAYPQLWLIPIALAALVAEHLDRERLSPGQSTGLRYLALGVIYISSTAGIIDSFVPQLILMLLSVLGVLAGIMLRVRSFLYLGVTFLLLDLTAMIRYAAFDLDQKWILYASGIVLGAAIIALFAVFEKRRNDVLAAVERFKSWER